MQDGAIGSIAPMGKRTWSVRLTLSEMPHPASEKNKNT
jgi:hypothetical protein